MITVENEQLETKVKEMLIKRLSLELSPEEIETDAPLFGVDENGRGLGLDSIDALEIIVGLNETFGIRYQNDNSSVLSSVKSLAEFIKEKQNGLKSEL